jgi:hypothetical protein
MTARSVCIKERPVDKFGADTTVCQVEKMLKEAGDPGAKLTGCGHFSYTMSNNAATGTVASPR